MVAAVSATLTTRFASPTLTAAHDAAVARGASVLGWRLDDGAEVLRVDDKVYVSDGGEVRERDDCPADVATSVIVAEMRSKR